MFLAISVIVIFIYNHCSDPVPTLTLSWDSHFITTIISWYYIRKDIKRIRLTVSHLMWNDFMFTVCVCVCVSTGRFWHTVRSERALKSFNLDYWVFLSLPLVRCSKHHANRLFSFSGVRKGAPTVLGPLERANNNHWIEKTTKGEDRFRFRKVLCA